MGGVPGGGKAAAPSQKLFKYQGFGTWAYAELEFTPQEDTPTIIFRLINREGSVMESFTF